MRGEVAARARADRLGERHRNATAPTWRSTRTASRRPPSARAGTCRTAPGWRATIAVEPPTEPAVCTRISGLPAAPSASARNSSGIITPSKKSGALPTTTASMSSNVEPGVGERLVDGLAHQAGHRDVLALGDVLGLPDAEDRGQLPCHLVLPFQDRDQILLQAGPLVACASTRCAAPSKMCRAATPMRSSPAANIGLAASAPPDGLTFVDVAKPDGLGEDQLLVGERRVELGDVDRAGCRRPWPPWPTPPSTATWSGRGRRAPGSRCGARSR